MVAKVSRKENFRLVKIYLEEPSEWNITGERETVSIQLIETSDLRTLRKGVLPQQRPLHIRRRAIVRLIHVLSAVDESIA
jgi:hypothetical protein